MPEGLTPDEITTIRSAVAALSRSDFDQLSHIPGLAAPDDRTLDDAKYFLEELASDALREPDEGFAGQLDFGPFADGRGFWVDAPLWYSDPDEFVSEDWIPGSTYHIVKFEIIRKDGMSLCHICGIEE